MAPAYKGGHMHAEAVTFKRKLSGDERKIAAAGAAGLASA